MDLIKETFSFLGHPVRDRVRGFTGIATSVSFDLYGCAHVLVTPPHDENRKVEEVSASAWFDVKRLQKCGDAIMTPPDFGATKFGAENGPADKPGFPRMPV